MGLPYGTNSNQRKERKQRTREAILAAAVDVFREYGFADGRIAHITEAARLSRQTFYIHFASKEELLIEILKGEQDKLLVHYEELAEIEERSPQRFAAWASQFIDHARDDSAIILVLMKTVPFESQFWGGHADYYDQVIAVLAERNPAFEAARTDRGGIVHSRSLLLFFQLEMIVRYAILDIEIEQQSMCLAWGEQWAEFLRHRERPAH